MEIALIGDTNLLYMPYHSNYAEVLKETNTKVTTITWDRLKIDDDISEIKFRDGKIGHQRNLFDYLRYIRFVKRKISEKNYDKVIVFGIPIAYFMNSYLLKYYRDKYIIDIRDYHKIMKYVNIEKLIEGSKISVISSPMYRGWLPNSSKYIVNHNTKISDVREIKPFNASDSKVINISFIGSTRDLQINIDLINSLKNNNKFKIFFHGAGKIDNYIVDYVKKNRIENVELTGRYTKNDEPGLYRKSDIINVLRYNDGINNETALPNRLYNSVFYGKPMLAYKGTYLDNIISKYKLGMVINTFNNLEKEIIAYFSAFNIEEYDSCRAKFLSQVIEENKNFRTNIIKFATE